MYTTLNDIGDKHGYVSLIEHNHIEDYIVNLYNNELIELNLIDSNKLLWNGNYYKDIKKNYDEMRKYYLMAIELNNSSTMYNLGLYYETIENYDEMRKYYLRAIELNNSRAMHNLGLYYQTVENYDEMRKYYLMAIELNNISAMNNLGLYYQTVEKNYNEMKKYYLMAIKLNDSNVIKLCENYSYFYDDNIKNTIMLKKFNRLEEKITCPITLDEINICYEIKKCNHNFSEEIFKVNVLYVDV